MSLLPLDGPSKQYAKSVTDSAVVEIKDGSEALDERKVVTIYPIDGQIWVFFGDGSSTPTANDVKTKGFPHFRDQMRSYEASPSQDVWIVSDDGTVDVRIAERA